MPRIKNQDEVKAYIQETVSKSEMDRTELNKGKTGCRLEGIKAINPVNGREVEVFIGDFVWQIMERVLLWLYQYMMNVTLNMRFPQY